MGVTTRRETVNIFQVLTTSMVKAEWGVGVGGGGEELENTETA